VTIATIPKTAAAIARAAPIESLLTNDDSSSGARAAFRSSGPTLDSEA
jgi:hypothetical protein